MRIIFLQSDTPREKQLMRALKKGIRLGGDEFDAMPPPKPFPQELDCDIVAGIGLKRYKWFEYCAGRGQRYLYFDKGFHDRWNKDTEKIAIWRVAVDSMSPVDFVATARMPPDRWQQLGRAMSPWRVPSAHGHIVVANSSRKYHQLHGLPPPQEWFEETVAQLRQYTDRPIYYRPKPRQHERGVTKAVPGTEYCPDVRLPTLFDGAHALVTYGSYIAVDALLFGVPAITLGPAVTRPLSSHSLAEIEHPRQAPDPERRQILANLAWTQFLLDEWSSGDAWRMVKELFIY